MSGQRGLILGLTIAYLAASFWVTTDHPPAMVSLILALGPVLVPFWSSLWKNSAVRLWLILALALGTALTLWQAAFLARHIAWFYFIQYMGIMLPLALAFGRTLNPNHGQALCSRLAQLIQPNDLSAPLLHHTWLVTWAWTIYFTGCAGLCVILFFGFPVATWSFFTDIITPLAMVTLFIAEWLIRRRRFPDVPTVSLLTTVQAWQAYQQTSSISR